MSAGLFLIVLCDFEPNTALIKSFSLKSFLKRIQILLDFIFQINLTSNECVQFRKHNVFV